MATQPTGIQVTTTHRFPRRHGPSRTRKGERYDNRHTQARKAAARNHQPTDRCARCHRPLGPMGRNLHYDHNEYGGYLGFSHAACNLRAGAIKGNQAQTHDQAWPARHTGSSYPIQTT